jgi:hypothetical protein
VEDARQTTSELHASRQRDADRFHKARREVLAARRQEQAAFEAPKIAREAASKEADVMRQRLKKQAERRKATQSFAEMSLEPVHTCKQCASKSVSCYKDHRVVATRQHLHLRKAEDSGFAKADALRSLQAREKAWKEHKRKLERQAVAERGREAMEAQRQDQELKEVDAALEDFDRNERVEKLQQWKNLQKSGLQLGARFKPGFIEKAFEEALPDLFGNWKGKERAAGNPVAGPTEAKATKTKAVVTGRVLSRTGQVVATAPHQAAEAVVTLEEDDDDAEPRSAVPAPTAPAWVANLPMGPMLDPPRPEIKPSPVISEFITTPPSSNASPIKPPASGEPAMSLPVPPAVSIPVSPPASISVPPAHVSAVVVVQEERIPPQAEAKPVQIEAPLLEPRGVTVGTQSDDYPSMHFSTGRRVPPQVERRPFVPAGKSKTARKPQAAPVKQAWQDWKPTLSPEPVAASRKASIKPSTKTGTPSRFPTTTTQTETSTKPSKTTKMSRSELKAPAAQERTVSSDILASNTSRALSSGAALAKAANGSGQSLRSLDQILNSLLQFQIGNLIPDMQLPLEPEHDEISSTLSAEDSLASSMTSQHYQQFIAPIDSHPSQPQSQSYQGGTTRSELDYDSSETEPVDLGVLDLDQQAAEELYTTMQSTDPETAAWLRENYPSLFSSMATQVERSGLESRSKSQSSPSQSFSQSQIDTQYNSQSNSQSNARYNGSSERQPQSHSQPHSRDGRNSTADTLSVSSDDGEAFGRSSLRSLDESVRSLDESVHDSEDGPGRAPLPSSSQQTMAGFAASRAFASPYADSSSAAPAPSKAHDPWAIPSPTAYQEQSPTAYQEQSPTAYSERPRPRPESARDVLHEQESSALDDALAFFRQSREQLMGNEGSNTSLGLDDYGDYGDDVDELEELGSSDDEDRDSQLDDSYLDYSRAQEGESSFDADLEAESLDMESDSLSTDVDDVYSVTGSSGLDDVGGEPGEQPARFTAEYMELLLAASGDMDFAQSGALAPVAEETSFDQDESFGDEYEHKYAEYRD